MQNNLDFEERIITAKRQLADVLAGERTAGTETHLQHAARIIAHCQRSHPAAQGRQPLNRKERSHFNGKIKPVEEGSLIAWAKESGLWITEDSFLKGLQDLFLDEGAEQKVYLSHSGLTVLKLNHGIYHGTWLEFFIRLMLHQVIFPSTQYSVAGFTKTGEQFAAILQQPFVDIKAGASNEVIASFLLPLGFINLRHCDYYNCKHGIILEDLHDENVFQDKAGVLYFVDPVIYFETPDLGLNGPSQFRFPF